MLRQRTKSHTGLELLQMDTEYIGMLVVLQIIILMEWALLTLLATHTQTLMGWKGKLKINIPSTPPIQSQIIPRGLLCVFLSHVTPNFLLLTFQPMILEIVIRV